MKRIAIYQNGLIANPDFVHCDQKPVFLGLAEAEINDGITTRRFGRNEIDGIIGLPYSLSKRTRKKEFNEHLARLTKTEMTKDEMLHSLAALYRLGNRSDHSDQPPAEKAWTHPRMAGRSLCSKIDEIMNELSIDGVINQEDIDKFYNDQL